MQNYTKKHEKCNFNEQADAKKTLEAFRKGKVAEILLKDYIYIFIHFEFVLQILNFKLETVALASNQVKIWHTYRIQIKNIYLNRVSKCDTFRHSCIQEPKSQV